MADWKVSAEQIELFPHPDADKLMIARVGMYALVVGKSSGYKDGDVVVFAPKRSILPEDLRGEYTNVDTGQSYLVGSDKSRVSSVKLRGELSEGVTIPLPYVLGKLGLDTIDQLPIGEDLSERLGITEHVPNTIGGLGFRRAGIGKPIPFERYSRHDVEGMRIFSKEFEEGELVVVTEKLHGSQIALMLDAEGTCYVSSKGVMGRGNCLEREADNVYWQVGEDSKVFEILLGLFPGKFVQAYGEVIPFQGGNWTYGQDQRKPTLRLFRVEVDGERLSHELFEHLIDCSDLVVPVIYEGPLDWAKIETLAKGTETVSGRGLHIREGVVVEPAQPRNAKRGGFPLYVKVINPKFKDSDDLAA